MSKINIKLGKVTLAGFVNKFNKRNLSLENQNKKELKKYNGPSISEKDKLSPYDSRCKQELVIDVTLLSNDYGIDDLGEQYTVEEHEVTYVDGTSKVFEVRTSSTGVTIRAVKKAKVSSK